MKPATGRTTRQEHATRPPGADTAAARWTGAWSTRGGSGGSTRRAVARRHGHVSGAAISRDRGTRGQTGSGSSPALGGSTRARSRCTHAPGAVAWNRARHRTTPGVRKPGTAGTTTTTGSRAPAAGAAPHGETPGANSPTRRRDREGLQLPPQRPAHHALLLTGDLWQGLGQRSREEPLGAETQATGRNGAAPSALRHPASCTSTTQTIPASSPKASRGWAG